MKVNHQKVRKMENKNISDSELRFRDAIINEFNSQVTETNQYIDIIENTLSSDDTIQKLESLAFLQNDIIQSKNKWLSVYLIEIKSEIEKLEILNRNGLLKPQTSPNTPELSNLLEHLKRYFQDCSQIDLETIIKHKQLPIGRKKILWNGTKADAIRFIEHFNITKAQFNKMFYFEDLKPLLAGHKDKIGTYSVLSDILGKYPK